jgi:hypothetical protein
MFDVKRFCSDYGIRYDVEGKNCRGGWVNIRCRFCDDHSNHGGFQLEDGEYFCWRCGKHPLPKVIQSILDVTRTEASDIISAYTRHITEEYLTNKYGGKSRENPKQQNLSLPKGSNELSVQHKKYLIKRGFDPDELIKTWKIKGTGPIGTYKFRIIIPIIVDGKTISYQARDITNHSELRYKACNIDEEIIHHKFVVYGIDHVQKKRTIIVEGILDAWKLGPGAVATFGTGWTKEQILFLSHRVKEAWVWYDNEPEAQKKAEKLCVALSAAGIEVENISQNDFEDPGAIPKKLAEKTRKMILGY